MITDESELYVVTSWAEIGLVIIKMNRADNKNAPVLIKAQVCMPKK